MSRFLIGLAASAALLSMPVLATVTDALFNMEPKQEEQAPAKKADAEGKKTTKAPTAKVNKKQAEDYTKSLNQSPAPSKAVVTPSVSVAPVIATSPKVEATPSVVINNAEGAKDAFKRLDNLSKWLQHSEKEGVEGAFGKLNNQGDLSIVSERRTEVLDRAADFQTRTNLSGDLMCFTSSKIVVSQDPGLIGRDASLFLDAKGEQLLPKFINATSVAPDHKAIVEYVMPVQMVSGTKTTQALSKKMYGVVYGKKALLGESAGKTRTRFLCVIPVEAR